MPIYLSSDLGSEFEGPPVQWGREHRPGCVLLILYLALIIGSIVWSLSFMGAK